MDTKKKIENNEQFMRRILKHPKTGAVMHGFIFDALDRHSKMISEMPIEELRKRMGENPFITPEIWQQAAKELRAELDARPK